MTKICCVCKRVERGLHWHEGYDFAPEERISHGYCPLCYDIVMADLVDIKNRTEGSEYRYPFIKRRRGDKLGWGKL